MEYENMVNDFLEEIEDFDPNEWLATQQAQDMMNDVYGVIATKSKRITAEDIAEYEGRRF